MWLGVVVMRYIGFLQLLIPTPIDYAHFCCNIVHLLICLSFLFRYFYCNLCNNFLLSINTHMGDYKASQGSYMKGCT